MTETTNPELSPVKRALQEVRELRARMEEMELSPHEPIAVIGMACRYPGGVNNPDDFWRLLCNGVDAITEIPKERWNIDSFYDPDPDAAGKILTRWGGFLDQVDQFDPHFFGISPREADAMDPQHRLLIQVAWEALEHAGQAPDKLTGSATGVFTGICVNDYYQMMVNQEPEKLDVYLAQGTTHSAAPGRISYLLGLQGPAMAIDTACSSSLVATHLAVQSLRNGECSMALAGGVNTILLPEVHISFSRARMISNDGRCKTFDARADGFVRSEGCGIIVLKRLADAITNGDNILAVIRGSAVNQDGRSNGMTAPNGLAQEALIRSALSNGLVDPSLVSYVEAHGTGTALGDPIEVQALGSVLGAHRNPEERLKIGSVKTNLGHLEAAAGVAGLMKSVLMLQHKQIPPHLHYESPNPYIPWDELPIEVTTSLSPLPAHDGRYIVGVSSFGFSGTNSHVILESAPEPVQESAEMERPLHLLKLSAKNQIALQALVERYDGYLAQSAADFADICYTANAGRADLAHRLAFAAQSSSEARAKLASFVKGEKGEDVFEGTVFDSASPEVVFLFTGHGSQYEQMSRQLFDTHPAFRATLTECEELLKENLDVSLFDILFPADNSNLLDKMKYGQPALFAVEYALAQLWLSWGIKPTTVLGHSVGEYVAACIAGVFSLADGLKVVCARGRLMDSLSDSGEMEAIFADEETVKNVIAPYGNEISIAVFNGPTNIVISGMPETLQAVRAALAEREIKTKRLAVTQAAHSHFLDPILDEFESVAQTVTYSPPRLGFVSCLTGRMVESDEVTNASYWRRHLRQPVRFADGMRTLYAEGYQHFIEIGPHPVLSGMAQRIEGAEGRIFTPSLRSGWEDWQQILESAASLYTHGIALDWEAFDKGYTRKRIPLPTYPWTNQRYWIPDATGREPITGTSKQEAWSAIVEAASFQSERGPLDLAMDTHPKRWDCLGRLTTAYIISALRSLGVFTNSGDTYSVDAVMAKGNIKSTYHGLLSRWLQKLSDAGKLQEKPDDQYVSKEPLPVIDPAPLLEEARGLFVDGSYLPDYLERSGGSLVKVLTGQDSPLDALFPGGSHETAEYLYRTMPMVRYFNGIARGIVESFVATQPKSSPIRVLEVGAGTGGTTSSLLPVLPRGRTVYYFTDLSEFFFTEAGTRFRNYPFIHFAVMDLERNPEEQGFSRHGFDLVVGANVFHATKDLDTALEHARTLLRPGGLLLLFETTTQPDWFESSIGLIEGWSRFEDEWRQDTPLIAVEQWKLALLTCGFEMVEAWPQPGAVTEVLGAHIIAAQASSGDDAAGMMTLPHTANIRVSDRNSTDASSGKESREEIPVIMRQLSKATPEEQEMLLVDYIRDTVIKVTRINPANAPDRRQRLMDFGVDSLMAVELRNRLTKGLGLPEPLPATLIFDYPTIEVIARYLANKIFDNAKASPSMEETKDPFSVRQAEIEELSEEETEAMLLKKLKDFSNGDG
jgi:acyl transferase domain-containing protein/SAM-dependent methyltransferase